MSDPSPLLAMRAGLITRFAADQALIALLGGSARLYDEPPRGALPVYALFGDGEVRDDSVDGAGRHLHRHELAVIARPGSARTALDAAARMAALLEATDMPLQGCRLVTIRVSALRATRDPRTGEARASLTVEAVTETF
ncbi:DUF3168 domain-containing protein [Methylobacterium persicinum]|uniref:DUF3168 domain-containing protein n=1 Tax=Methylobacterium persicinum TaxID=374426 RepID=A0ABU0HFK2_9HYPH|nr:DUF3168 domain-containing protein [Methylobacterium persicinum]MDQ0441099.1 hypothetical protein [Methylobacterium persicinum]GJE40106.1 hypothetical protein KHHGKMAE_4196 [Methylobacterium persicinum]